MSKIDLSALTNFIKQKNNSSYVENGVINIKSEFATKADLIREILPLLRGIIESEEYVKYVFKYTHKDPDDKLLIDYCEALITSEDKTI